MRFVVAALALLGLAACDGGPIGADSNGSTPAGYRLEVRALEGVQTYLITAPDGKVVGAQAADGASRLLDDQRIQEIADTPMPADADAPPEVMSLKLPGFEMSINADQNETGDATAGDATAGDATSGDDGGNAQVKMRVRGQEMVSIDARENGPGDADDIAHVVISGASEETARDFITDADELSEEVKQQMRAALGFN
ncbi:hypothetical protein [Terricaulis sp.]|uniref:hypothetical protein n=1 Tax=Terricaulis sp. TaxID=2768686 RepID=UPI003784325A